MGIKLRKSKAKKLKFVIINLAVLILMFLVLYMLNNMGREEEIKMYNFKILALTKELKENYPDAKKCTSNF